jgi:ribosomal protein S18 acetylase RimI-like enzyme
MHGDGRPHGRVRMEVRWGRRRMREVNETQAPDVTVRPLEDTDLGGIVALDEKIGGRYRPEVWEDRLNYYTRRDPEACMIAEADGRLVGFMLGEMRAGEFGLEEPTGWIEVLGVDPELRGRAVGRRLADAMLSHFRESGARVVRTLVDEGMGGIAEFFAALGFERAPIQAFMRDL